MTKETLYMIHRYYQNALQQADNLLDIVEKLYKDLSEVEVNEEDSKVFDSFIDGLRGCIQYRKMTFELTNMSIYLNVVFMYIVMFLNSTKGLKIDIDFYSRRKSLESDLIKLLKKAYLNPSTSSYIRDRFGLRGILLNNLPSEEANKLLYIIFEAIQGIIAGRDRKMCKDFITWYNNLPDILSPDKAVLDKILAVPFTIDFVKDFIAHPKKNSYKSLQFTLIVQVYSKVLPGGMFEVQLRTKEMHENAEHGPASHFYYKNPDLLDKTDGDGGEDDEILKIIRNEIFVVDDFSKLHITGFTSYDSKEDDRDGIHFSKDFSDRRVPQR